MVFVIVTFKVLNYTQYTQYSRDVIKVIIFTIQTINYNLF